MEHDVLDKRLNILDDIKNLIISYAGLTLQDPSMFPQPSKCVPLSLNRSIL